MSPFSFRSNPVPYERIFAYADDHNIHSGLKDSRLSKLFWFNPLTLLIPYLNSGQQLLHCHYFTARFRHSQPVKREKQAKWLDALLTLPKELITLHFGVMERNKLRCHECEARLCSCCNKRMQKYVEKRTDVNLATQLLVDAFDNKFDIAFVVSGDSDLCDTIDRILNRFPNKQIVVVFPPGRLNKDLEAVASGCFTIGEDKLRACQFPDEISVAGKEGSIVRPKPWYESKVRN